MAADQRVKRNLMGGETSSLPDPARANAAAGPQDADAFYGDAFRRNIGLLTEVEQRRLRSATVAIAGMGGVGGIHLVTLVRLGIGRFRIADPDEFDVVNINRQFGASAHSLGRNKAAVMREVALGINPFVEIDCYESAISRENIDPFLAGADIIVDGLDFFAVDARRLLFQKARECGAYAITSGPLGFSATLHVFSPGGMTFDRYFDLHDGMSPLEQVVAFAIGLAPKATQFRYMNLGAVNPGARTGPSLSLACHLCSGVVATEVLAILLKRRPPKAAPHYVQFDPYVRVYKRGYLWLGNRNPIQRAKRRRLLHMLSGRAQADSRHGAGEPA
jgi:molybdopterin/thiamine biosynthesis adenylyltransferase